jgi:plasmid stability protein
MPTLHVRNVPEPLYERIRACAESEKMSISAEVINLLERAHEQSGPRPKRDDRACFR